MRNMFSITYLSRRGIILLLTFFFLALGIFVYPAFAQAAGRLSYVGPEAYDISNGKFVDTFSVATQETYPTGMTFNSDGTKLYVVGTVGDDVNEYNLSTPYDVSTGTFVDTFSVSDHASDPQDIAFNEDGTKLYVLSVASRDVVEYHLSTPYDVSTGTFDSAFDVSSQEINPRGLAFNNDGTKMYVIGTTVDDINEYSLLTAYDVSTASFVDTFSVAAQDTNPTGMAFNHDGTKLYVIGFSGDQIYEYDLSTDYDVSTGSYSGSFSVVNQELNSEGFAFNNDGTKFYVIGMSGDDVNEYMLDAGDYPENPANDGSIDNSNPLIITVIGDTFQDTDADNLLDIGSEVTIGNVPAGLTPIMTLSSGDSVVTLTFTGNATNNQNSDSVSDLTFVFDDTAFVGGDASLIVFSGSAGAYSTNVGIHFDDQPILSYYRPESYDVTTGEYVDMLSVSAQENQTEGIAFNNNGTKVYLIGTTNDTVYEFHLSVADDISTGVYADSFSVSAQDDASYEVLFNNDGTKLYVLGGQNDNVYEYDLSYPYSVSTASYVDSFSISAQTTSPDGMAFNNDGTKLYILGYSDVFEYDLSTPFDVSTGSYVDSLAVTNISESIAFNFNGTKLIVGNAGLNNYIETYELTAPFDVSTGMLASSYSISSVEEAPKDVDFNYDGTKYYVLGRNIQGIAEFSVDPGDYPEAVANDGSIDNTNPIIIRLQGDTFQDMDADDLLDVGSEVTIGNVPAGLTPVMTLSDSDSVVTLTFTVNATNHTTPDSISNLTFIFDNTAFVGGVASIITNSGSGGAYNTNVGIAYLNPESLGYTGLDFTENITNDGSVSGGPITATLIGGTFQDTDADDMLDVGSEVTIGNVPAGLTPVVALSGGDTVAAVTFTGNAANHTIFDDIVDLTFVFDDTAFTVGDASLVTNSGDGGAYSSNLGIYFRNSRPYRLDYVGPDSYDVLTGVYSDTFSVSAQDGDPEGLAFNDDGSKLFVVGDGNDLIYEYNLTAPYDVSTAVYADYLDISDESGTLTSLAFNHDGTKLYILDSYTDELYEFELVIPYRLSKAAYLDSLDVSANETNANGMAFNHDGTKLYVIGSTGDEVDEYDLSPAYDISTGSYVDSLSVSAQETVPQGLAFNHDGTKLYVIGSTGDEVDEYDLSPAYDISTGSYAHSFSVADQEGSSSDVAFNNDGTKFYIIGYTGDDIDEYSIDPGDYPEALADDGSVDNSNLLSIELRNAIFQDVDDDDFLDVGSEVAIGNVPAGLTPLMTLSNSDTVVTLTFAGNASRHKSANDVAELTFAFDDTAFDGGDASAIENSGYGGAFSSNVGIDFVGAASGGGGGGGSSTGTTSTTPEVAITSPTAGDGFPAESFFDVYFEVSGLGIDTVDIGFSENGGIVTEVVETNVEINESPVSVQVPSGLEGPVYLVVRAYDSGKAKLDTDMIEIEIVAPDLAPEEPEEATPEQPPEPITQDSPLTEEEIAAGIVRDSQGRKILPLSGETGISPWNGETEPISIVRPGWYIRSYNYNTVYYVNDDYARRTFWDATTFMTWAHSWDDVYWVTDATLATLNMGAVMLPQPSSVLVKISTDPRTYHAVYSDDPNTFLLRWITTETLAVGMLGEYWADYIIDLEPTVFTNYGTGDDITTLEENLIFADDFESGDYGAWSTREEIAERVAGY